MDKDEILEKSRKDNGPVDERFKVMEYRTTNVMVSVMLAMWLVLFLWDTFTGGDTPPPRVGSAIMLSGVAAMAFCRLYQLRMKSALVFGLLAAFGALSFAIKHIMLTL